MSFLIQQTLIYAVPLMIVALAGVFAERSGIINLALDGIMTLGALAGVLCVSLLGPTLGYQTAVTLGILLGALVGVLTSVLLAFASVNMNADQTICGTAINLLAAALAVYLSREIAGVSIVVINSLPRFDIPLLSKIPVLGPILFSSTYATTWLILALTVLSWYVIEKTPFGLRLRSCGEHPQAADAAGINVYRMQYAGKGPLQRCSYLGRLRGPRRGGLCADGRGSVHGQRQRPRLHRPCGPHLRPVAHIQDPHHHALFRFRPHHCADLHALVLLLGDPAGVSEDLALPHHTRCADLLV